LRNFLLSFCFTVLAVHSSIVLGSTDDLPDIGSSADTMISTSEEYRIGRQIVRGLRQAGRVMEDALLDDYIEGLGHKLVVHAHDGEHRFTFFMVRDDAINAFAMPGGFIGVNAGLMLATRNESELAGVMAHEVAHVTQRHVVRRAQSTQRTSMVTTAALIAALLVGVTTGASPDAMQAMIMVTQGAAMQQQINYTRSNEYEADRVGIGYLAAAGYEPESMADFFETMNTMSGVSASRAPEFLRTHPMGINRIAEAKNRAANFPPRTYDAESESYWLMRERLRVLMAENADKALEYYQQELAKNPGPQPDYVMYGYGLALKNRGLAADAEGVFTDLLNRRSDVIAYHLGLAESQMVAGDLDGSLSTFENAYRLFPRNVPVTVAYSEGLLRAGRAAQAHRVLLDLLNRVPPTSEQARLIAIMASAEGDMANAHYYMSEYHLINGDLPMAVNQLQLALAQPDLEPVQRARYQARLQEISKYLTPEMQRGAQRSRAQQSS
jgi:predicted Zn-dependent protease